MEAWKIKNDPGHIRFLLRHRDKGICAACGCDSEAEYAKWRAAVKVVSEFVWALHRKGDERVEWNERRKEWWFLPREKPDYQFNAKRTRELMEKWKPPGDWTSGRSSGWDADHILEVVNGGGQCGLENYQTLCHPCHKAKTRRLAGELAAQRRAARGPRS